MSRAGEPISSPVIGGGPKARSQASILQSENQTSRHSNGASAARDRCGTSAHGRFPALQPRLVNASEAARYLGHQSRAVLKEIPVSPIRLTRTGVGRGALYDLNAIDRWLDELSGIRQPTTESASAKDDPQSEFEEWRRAHYARHN